MRHPHVCLILLCAILLSSCTENHDFEAGESLSPDGLASLSSELVTDKEEVDTADGFHTREIVYWTEGGSVYHRDRSCSHLKKSENVVEGSVKHARKEGKDRPCSTCGET